MQRLLCELAAKPRVRRVISLRLSTMTASAQHDDSMMCMTVLWFTMIVYDGSIVSMTALLSMIIASCMMTARQLAVDLRPRPVWLLQARQLMLNRPALNAEQQQ
jgi:hypothetical protein